MERKSGEIIFFPGSLEDGEYRDFTTEYAEASSEHLINTLSRHGLAPEFLDFTQRFICDLNLVIRDDRHSIHNDEEKPRLDVVGFTPQGGGQNPIEADGRQKLEWKRIITLDLTDIFQRAKLIEEVLKRYGFVEIDTSPDILAAVAVDWIFGEEAYTAASSACFMHNNHSKYIQDYNAQNPNVRAEHYISSSYAALTGTGLSAKKDYESAKRGFGFIMLHDSLVGRGVIQKAKIADWILEELRLLDKAHNQQEALRASEIQERLQAVIPSSPRERYLSYFINLPPDEVVQDDD